MNGRVYDPKVGRFISADPFIPNPGNTQSFNRYSYVLNNPLSLVDPSGFDERHGGGMVVFSWINGSRDPAGMAVVERRWPSSINVSHSQPTPQPPPDPPNPDPPGPVTNRESPSASTTSCQSDVLDCGTDEALRRFTDFLIGENGGAAWGEAWREEWVDGPTGGKVPPSVYEGLEQVGANLPQDAYKNGMHAWHAGSNAYLAKQYGLLGMPAVLLAGGYHESPADWNSFWAEQGYQGTVNHMLDSATDMVANAYGYTVGLVGGESAVETAVRTGNYIPGPGEPDPAFGGNGAYRGNPSDAWGQYPQSPPGGQ